MSTYLIVGLGNPGAAYAGTRHNIGFDALDGFVASHKGDFTLERHAEKAHIRWKGRTIVCIKPTTLMNLSGKAVKYWLDKEAVSLEHILVVVDEIALPLSKLRLNVRGSDGGHNGLKSIQEYLGTQCYARLRLGIGNQYPKGGQVDFVLGKWTADESPIIGKKLNQCPEIIDSFIFHGADQTMTRYNNLTFNA
ncbi:MAG: aminoacyl-tRNA hydrolase [Bacteroidetes bacterium]|nr:aminoacyl-tRNA hydrolase [Bacteroidota bacterium]